MTKWHATLITFVWTLNGIIEYLDTNEVYDFCKGLMTTQMMSVASVKGLRLIK